MIGILPALLIIYIRIFVKEPEVWVENRRQQTIQYREMRTPLFSIFKLGLLGNTLTTCLMMASAFVSVSASRRPPFAPASRGGQTQLPATGIVPQGPITKE